MTFDELNLIVQAVAVNNLAMQDTINRMQAVQLEAVTTNEELQLLALSIARGVQAMQDQELTNQLKHDERMAGQDAQIARLDHIAEGLVNLLTDIDTDRPTILRKLNTIENRTSSIEAKVDGIIDRLPPQ